MIRSPLRYPGGKSRAVAQIHALIPEFQEFREPFVGGGSVFLHERQQRPEAHFWINDVYAELYQFWRGCQLHLTAIQAQVEAWKTRFSVGKDLFSFLNATLPSMTEIERAAAFFVFNRITFSGTTLSGGYSEQAFQGRFTTSSMRRLDALPALLQHCHITNLDFEPVIRAAGESVFIFLDPPYYSATGSALYGKNGHLHKGFDHERLAQVLRETPHRWLMTYDDSPFIRALYDFAYVTPWNLMYGMRNVGGNRTQVGAELFIANYPIC